MEWHPSKNGSLTPYDISKSTNKKVWWMCNNKHEWEASVANRHNGTSCPHCVKEIIQSKLIPLSSYSPELAKEWHPTKNGTLKASDVSKSSGKKVWWRCTNDDNHEWQAIVARRQNGASCPHCRKNSFDKKNPKDDEDKLIDGWNKKIVPLKFKDQVINLIQEGEIFDAGQLYLKLANKNGSKNPKKIMEVFEKIVNNLIE